MQVWQGPHGRAVAQPLKEHARFDYHLSTTWAQLMSVQGYNTFIHTRLLGNKWQYENDLSDVIGVCTEFIWNNEVTTTEWLLLVQQWQMSCCDVSFCWCRYSTPPPVSCWWTMCAQVVVKSNTLQGLSNCSPMWPLPHLVTLTMNTGDSVTWT